MAPISTALRRAANSLPASVAVQPEDWDQRHRWISGLLWLHVPVVAIFGLLRGFPPLHTGAETVPVAALALLATTGSYSRRRRGVAAAMGLMVASAVLVHLSGGMTEVHFHFFVMLAVISLYQDWLPFIVAIAFVAAHHAIMGSLRPHDVFDHSAAWNSPLKWAAIHAFFVLCACATNVVSWRIVENGHKRSRAALEASERRYRSLVEHATDIVTVIDKDGYIVYDSSSSARILGYASEERIGTKADSYVHPDDLGRILGITQKTVVSGITVGNIELRIRHRDGVYRWAEVNVTNLLDEPAVAGIVSNVRDIDERRTLEDQLAHQAFHDPLTGLANRALLIDRVEHARAAAHRRPGSYLALVYVDLDDFKTINDGLGHEAGDELLRVTADRIASSLRPGDTAARLGGDEFAILLEELPNPSVAYDVGARLIEALREPFDVAGNAVPANASVGIAVSRGDDDAAALLRNADLAMYRAKGQGKGRFEVYEAGMHAAVVERMAMKADLRRAIAAGEFEPYYQPIVDLATGRTKGVEALVRWRHPERGLMAPAAFIPLAEETGLIIDIGRHVLSRACADAAQWQRTLGSAAPSTISVNLSARQVQHPGLRDDVRRALQHSGLSPKSLILEVTESILLEDATAAARTLADLKSLGLSIALDDFGTGYSSLSYLDRFPVDVVKIDKSFIDSLAGTEAGHQNSPLVAAIVNLGMLLGLKVTAEGIEEGEQIDRLRQMGCELGQGYFFAKPMPANELTLALSQAAAEARAGVRGRPADAPGLNPVDAAR